MKEPRVCHVSPLSIHLYRWMRAFVQRVYNVSLISDSQAWLALKKKSTQVYALPILRKTNYAQQFIPNCLRIVRILKRINPDFVHLHVQHRYSLAHYPKRICMHDQIVHEENIAVEMNLVLELKE